MSQVACKTAGQGVDREVSSTAEELPVKQAAPFRVAIVGNPNVGKSSIFNRMASRYVTVSNYPGTTVTVTRACRRLGDLECEFIDTPGAYSLLPVTEEERVARRVLLEERPDLVLHLVDAKNLKRMLPMTLQLIEAGLPLILVLNMADEAERGNITINREELEKRLGVPVVATVGTTGRGIQELREAVMRVDQTRRKGEGYDQSRGLITYGEVTEQAIAKVAGLFEGDRQLSARSLACLALQGDREIIERFGKDPGGALEVVGHAREDCRHRGVSSPNYQISMTQLGAANSIAEEVVKASRSTNLGGAERLSRLLINPLTGGPILLAVLYFGLYKFVGVFGGGTLVNLIENGVFGSYVNPWLVNYLGPLIPTEAFRQLLVGQYGVLTLGVRYAVAIVLPVVGTFFLFFAILEDSGYLPRLALLIDRLFKIIGLNGRAVIPMVLGFGCDTMATIVTRTLETQRERMISTFLLALAIPCSAQLGVILALLSSHGGALLMWGGILTSVFLLIGFLTAKILPGEPPSFYMELPPLRVPQPLNVLIKFYSRVRWYFWEVFPLFIVASVIIWLGQLTGVFDLTIGILRPLVRFLGLPDEAAVAFLFGFFRRDYGAAGLFDISSKGLLTGNQLLVAAVTLTLFMPCVAQFLVMCKERGVRATVAMSAIIVALAFAVGGSLHFGLALMEIHL